MWRQGRWILWRALLAHRAWRVCCARALQQRRHPALSFHGRDCQPTRQRLLPRQGAHTPRDASHQHNETDTKNKTGIIYADCLCKAPVFYYRLRRMVQAFRAVVWLLESPLSSQWMPSKVEKLLWRSWLRCVSTCSDHLSPDSASQTPWLVMPLFNYLVFPTCTGWWRHSSGCPGQGQWQRHIHLYLHPTQACKTHCHGLLGRSQHTWQPVQSECTLTHPQTAVLFHAIIHWSGLLSCCVFWSQMNIGAGCHPNKVKVSGPGVAKTGLKAFEPTYFTVDCAEAGQGKVTHP